MHIMLMELRQRISASSTSKRVALLSALPERQINCVIVVEEKFVFPRTSHVPQQLQQTLHTYGFRNQLKCYRPTVVLKNFCLYN